MPTSLSSLNSVITAGVNVNAAVNATGFNNGRAFNNNEVKRINLSTNAANSAANGADECYASIVPVTAGGTATLTISSLTDVCNQTALSFVHVKALYFQLLSPTDDSVEGTLCSSVTIGGAANPFDMQLTAGSFFTLLNGDVQVYGTGNATGLAVSSGVNDEILITNDDGAVDAAVVVIIVGCSS